MDIGLEIEDTKDLYSKFAVILVALAIGNIMQFIGSNIVLDVASSSWLHGHRDYDDLGRVIIATILFYLDYIINILFLVQINRIIPRARRKIYIFLFFSFITHNLGTYAVLQTHNIRHDIRDMLEISEFVLMFSVILSSLFFALILSDVKKHSIGSVCKLRLDVLITLNYLSMGIIVIGGIAIMAAFLKLYLALLSAIVFISWAWSLIRSTRVSETAFDDKQVHQDI